MVALIKALPDNAIAGIFYIVGAVFWTLESLLSVWVIRLVYSNFRGNKVREGSRGLFHLEAPQASEPYRV
jgi:hypothetical protein